MDLISSPRSAGLRVIREEAVVGFILFGADNGPEICRMDVPVETVRAFVEDAMPYPEKDGLGLLVSEEGRRSVFFDLRMPMPVRFNYGLSDVNLSNLKSLLD